MFAQSEQRRLQAKKTTVAYKKREREQELEKEMEEREKYRAEKEWAEGTEGRVGDWREFMGIRYYLILALSLSPSKHVFMHHIGHKAKKAKIIAVPELKTEVRAGKTTALDHLDKVGASYKKKWR